MSPVNGATSHFCPSHLRLIWGLRVPVSTCAIPVREDILCTCTGAFIYAIRTTGIRICLHGFSEYKLEVRLIVQIVRLHNSITVISEPFWLLPYTAYWGLRVPVSLPAGS